jgi:hypothetical protein
MSFATIGIQADSLPYSVFEYIPAQSNVRAYCLENLDDPNTKEIKKGLEFAKNLWQKEALVKLLDKAIEDLTLELDNLHYLQKQKYLLRNGIDINSQEDIDLSDHFYNLLMGELYIYKKNQKKYKTLSHLEEVRTRVKEFKENFPIFGEVFCYGVVHPDFIKEHFLPNIPNSESFKSAFENILKTIDPKRHEQERAWITDGLENAFENKRPQNCYTTKEKVKETLLNISFVVFNPLVAFFGYLDQLIFKQKQSGPVPARK